MVIITCTEKDFRGLKRIGVVKWSKRDKGFMPLNDDP